MKSENKLTKLASLAAMGTLSSRVFGYIRDMLVAQTFGAGLFADAFYAAYRIPNLFRRLLGEGSLSASCIPVLSEYLKNKSKEETQELINVLFTALLSLLSIICVIGVLLSPQIVNLIAYGFNSDPEKIAITVSLTRIMFPFLLFVSISALILSVLNTLNSFFIPAMAPASLSVSEILYILSIAPLLTPENKIKGLAISVVVGGAGQFFIQLPKLKSLFYGLKIKFNFKHPGLLKIGKLMLPATLGISVDQLNAFINTILASFLIQGSITALYYSNRLMQLPLALFGLAVASVSLPAMSKAAAENDIPKVKETLNYSLRIITFIILPSTVGLIVIGLPIIRVLFERGRFDYDASMLTNRALFYYSLGLPAFACVKILASAFYSFKDTKTPVIIAAVSVIINIVLCLTLMNSMGIGGLAAATSIASWFNAFLLAILLRKKLGILGLTKLLKTVVKTLIASLVMALVCYMVSFKFMESSLYIGTFLSILCGTLVYFGLAHALNIEERHPLYSIILNEKRK